MRKSGAQSLPVVMYHYVNRLESSITISPERFDEHCRTLAEKGLRGVGLDEAEAFLIRGEALAPGSVLLTFDDGFLDNYLHALPALARYGHKAAIFAVSNRLEKADAPRVPMSQVLAGQAPSLLPVDVPVDSQAGISRRKDVFLNHAEARLAHQQGLLALASHSRGHYGVFAGPQYEGLFRPCTRFRTFYRTEMEPVYGLPDFKVKAGLANRAFVPDPEMVEAVKKLVPQDFAAAADFFKDAVALKGLSALLESWQGRMGRMESDEERTQRMRREIAGGKEELERILGAEVKSLCWPWGDYCEEARQLALEAGFEVLFTTREGVNPPASPLAVRRFKGKDESGAWLASRVKLYARPLLGALYARIRI